MRSMLKQAHVALLRIRLLGSWLETNSRRLDCCKGNNTRCDWQLFVDCSVVSCVLADKS